MGEDESLTFLGNDSSVLRISPDGSIKTLMEGFDRKKTSRKYLSLAKLQNGIIVVEQNYDDTLSFVFAPGNRSISTMERITGGVTGMWINGNFRHATEFSANGELFLACGRDGDILLFRTENGECVFRAKGEVRGALACRLSNDGSIASVVDESGNINVWNLKRSKITDSFVVKSCKNLAFHSHDKLAVAGEELIVRHYDKTSETYYGEVTCLSVCEEEAATGMADGTLRIYDVESLSVKSEFLCHDGKITDCNLLPKKQGIITVGEDCAFGIWGIDGRKIQFIENAHNAIILSCTSDKEGRFVLTTGKDRRTKLFSPVNGSLVSEMRHAEKPSVSAVSPDGKKAVVGLKDGTLEFLEIPSFKSIAGIKTGNIPITALGWDPSSQRTAVSTEDQRIIICQLSPTPNIERIFETEEQFFNITFLTDNQLVLCGKSRVIKILDVNTGKISGRFFTQGEYPVSVTIAETNCLLTGDNTGSVCSLCFITGMTDG